MTAVGFSFSTPKIMSASISNVGAIRKLELRFSSRITIVAGGKDTGKSTLRNVLGGTLEASPLLMQKNLRKGARSGLAVVAYAPFRFEYKKGGIPLVYGPVMLSSTEMVKKYTGKLASDRCLIIDLDSFAPESLPALLSHFKKVRCQIIATIISSDILPKMDLKGIKLYRL